MIDGIKNSIKNADRKKLFIYITILITAMLCIFRSVYIFNFKYDFNGDYQKYNVSIIEKRKEDDEKVSYLVKYLSNKFVLNIYIKDKNENLNFRYGDELEIVGRISKSERLNNPYEFDYRKYLNSNNIVATINTYSIKSVEHTKGNPFYYYILKFKEEVVKIVNDNMGKREASIFKALIYSDKSGIESEDILLFKNNGISHMMAVSGMHITYLMLIINVFTKQLKKGTKILIHSFFLFSYIIMSSFSISAIRAGIMSILSVYFKDKKGYNKYIGIILSLIFILYLNPYTIFNSSFLMSYFATLGIIVLNPIIKSYFLVYFKIPKILYNILEIICISICSLIFIFPFQVLFFGNINLKSFISNLVISNIISICYFLSFLFNFLVFIPYVNLILVKAIYVILKLIVFILEFLNFIPIPILNIPRFSYFEVFLYYMFILLILNKKYIYKYFSKKYWKRLKLIIVALKIAIILILAGFTIYRIYFENYIWYFNVGQGNMCIIRQDRKVVIYDMGSTTKNLGYNVLDNFLKAKAITNIDLVILSHMHEDHTNAIYDISKKYNINKIVYPVTYETSYEYTKITNLIENTGIDFSVLYNGTNIKVGKNIDIYCISPNNQEKIVSKDILNANSLVSIITVNQKFNYLFMGDATIETEKCILNKNLDIKIVQKLKNLNVVQIGHHGSKTSS